MLRAPICGVVGALPVLVYWSNWSYGSNWSYWSLRIPHIFLSDVREL